MRKNQRWLMMLITIIVIVAFVFLYNRTNLDKLGQTSVGSIYGKPVSGTDFERHSRLFDVARELGMFELLQGLVGQSRNQLEDYVWNTLILRHQAELLQIAPSEAAVAAKIQELPPFQTDGQFDLEKYNNFVANSLTPRGFSEGQLEELVRDELRLEKILTLVGSASAVSEDEVRTAYGEAVRKRHLLAVKIKKDLAAGDIAVSPEEIKARFEKNKDLYQNPEKRSVRYVALQLSDEQKKLTGKEKIAALQPNSNKADAFSERLVKAGANFDAIAKDLAMEVKTSPVFTQQAPPPDLASIPQFAPSAFNLTPEAPDSDVLQTEDAFYILHLDKIEPAQPQTLDQATAQITNQLQEEKTSAALKKRGTELRATLQAALQSGKTFAEAAKSADLPVETLPPFSPAEQQQSQDFSADRILQMTTSRLEAGAISEFIPTQEGGAIAYVESIEPLDDAKWNGDKETVVDRYSSSKREISFSEWFRTRRALANLRQGSNAS